MKVVLFQPDISGNVGATIRLCACFETPLEIIEPCGFPLTDKALRRAAMDYGNQLDIIRHTNWESFLKTVTGRIILFTTKAASAITEYEFLPDDILLFGQESSGAPEVVHKRADGRVIIPISPKARSFNLATSVAIGLFEARRQVHTLI